MNDAQNIGTCPECGMKLDNVKAPGGELCPRCLLKSAVSPPLQTYKIGEILGNRWKIRQIHTGGMGVVYILHDHESDASNQPVAAKTYRYDLLGLHPCISQRFEREASAWIQLDTHPNIVRARQVLWFDEQMYLFIEYVGDNLGDRISRGLNPADALRFGAQLCDGMTHLLRKGISAHRDIKPQNCLVTKGGDLKITDFGISRIFDDLNELPSPQRFERNPKVGDSLERLDLYFTRTGAIAGTPTHMAPEQFEGAKGTDVRADIYSFGVTLFQMLTRRLPFSGKTFQEFARLHKLSPVPRIAPVGLSPETLSNLNDLLHTCLEKEPASRFQHFADIRCGLSTVFESITGTPLPDPAVGSRQTTLQLAQKTANLIGIARYEDAVRAADDIETLNYVNLLKVGSEDFLLTQSDGNATDFEEEARMDAVLERLRPQKQPPVPLSEFQVPIADPHRRLNEMLVNPPCALDRCPDLDGKLAAMTDRVAKYEFLAPYFFHPVPEVRFRAAKLSVGIDCGGLDYFLTISLCDVDDSVRTAAAYALWQRPEGPKYAATFLGNEIDARAANIGGSGAIQALECLFRAAPTQQLEETIRNHLSNFLAINTFGADDDQY